MGRRREFAEVRNGRSGRDKVEGLRGWVEFQDVAALQVVHKGDPRNTTAPPIGDL